MKRLLALTLCAVMALSCAGALAENGHGPLWIADDVTLTYWIPIDSTAAQYYETYADHPFFKWMEEQTGVHVEFIHPSWEQMEQQFNLMVASGNYYDMLYYPTYPDGPQQAVADGVFADIEQFRDIMPDYFKAIECDDGTFADWEWGAEKEFYYAGVQPAFKDLLTTVQGNVWCVSQVWTDALSCECGAVIRQDWLDDAGLEMPQTIADLEKVLEAFKARGEDVIPMSFGSRGFNDGSGAVETAFGVYQAWFTATDGKVDPVACTTPAYKEYLTLLNSWYTKGYIDPDFMNRDGDGENALFLSDRLGIIIQGYSSPEHYEELYTGADPDFKVSAMPNPRMSEDQVLQWRQMYDSSATNYTCIAEHSPNKEIAAKWLNVMFTKEGILRSSYGVEGESYTLVDGAPYYTDWFYNNPDGYDTSTLAAIYLFLNSTNYYSVRANALLSGDPQTVLTEPSDWFKASSVWGANAEMNQNIGYVVFDGDGWGQMYDQYVEAQTYAEPMILKFITGAESLDNFDAFAQKALDMGFAGARDDMQASYDIQHGLN